jgi:nitroimidazol reductase NimA-like FMN-containing flavoprotein (pyridoxamine 5'-phosphate oxidase superfamily)
MSDANVDPRARSRRPDRGKDDAWIRAYLKVAPIGFLATVDSSGQPFLNSNLFVYDEDEHCIYLHTARRGRTRDNVEAHEKVCFSVAGMGRMLPADEALEFSVEYAGVVVFGTGRVVEDLDEARRGLQMLLERYAPHLEAGRDYRAITPEEMKRTSTYRIDIEAWSGKQKEERADFPGAYEMPEVPIPFPAPTEDRGRAS